MRVSTALYGLLTCWFRVYFCWTVSFVENDRPLSFHGAPDGWESARFQAVVWLEVGSVKAALSRPAHQRVTQAVEAVEKVGESSTKLQGSVR
jgi:hypothetical protein